MQDAKAKEVNGMQDKDIIEIRVLDLKGTGLLPNDPFGYVLDRNENIVCFYMDMLKPGFVTMGVTGSDWPALQLEDDVQGASASICFPSLSGFNLFSSKDGDCIHLTYVKNTAWDDFYATIRVS